MAATLPELEKALMNAHLAGDSEAARKLAAVVKREQSARAGDPRFDEKGHSRMGEEYPVNETIISEREPSIVEKTNAALEVASTLGTGMTGGIAGQITGSVEGIINEVMSGEFGSRGAADRIEKLAMQRAQELTFEPRSELGKEYLHETGKSVAPLAALPVLAETQAIASVAGRAAQQGRLGAQQLVQEARPQVQQAATEIARQVRERLPQRTSNNADRSAGAAEVAAAELRQAQADELPVPIKLTEGQKTRDFSAQRFERETAKLPDEGRPIRDRFDEQNLRLQQNLDEFIDATGAGVTDLRGVGEVVDKALRSRAARDKTRIRTLYKDAEKAGEMEAPVQLDTFVKHLTDSAPEAEVANVLKAVRAKALQLGAAIEAPDGSLVARPVSLKNAELLRRSINGATNAEPTNIRQAAIMKDLIDSTTENAGGSAYRQARAARTRYARDYENVGLVRNLLGTKRGADDRAIALEDVVRKSILDPSTSLDSVRQVRRLLQTRGGDQGKQAWRELQGATLRHIQDQMLKGVTTNSRGDKVVSAAQLNRAIENLDKTGKLDFTFGKKGAEQLRTINDVAKTVLTSPPGTVNTSNTATVLAGMMDIALTGTTGIPAPLATSVKLLTDRIKDARLKARIKKTLGDNDGG